MSLPMSSKSLLATLLVLGCTILIVYANGGGHSTAYRKQDHTGHYAFGYHIHDPWGSHRYRKEHGDGWHVKTEYHVDIHHPHGHHHWGHDDHHHNHWGHHGHKEHHHWGH